uniref:Uncharacterized protein n=1 Tax=Rhizophora mucronata TaxID=61149 RepID=A0A2P2QPB8_RHIMU
MEFEITTVHFILQTWKTCNKIYQEPNSLNNLIIWYGLRL